MNLGQLELKDLEQQKKALLGSVRYSYDKGILELSEFDRLKNQIFQEYTELISKITTK